LYGLHFRLVVEVATGQAEVWANKPDAQNTNNINKVTFFIVLVFGAKVIKK
jgi:hypothetical protein